MIDLHRLRRIAVCVIAISLTPATKSLAAVEGFAESFDGTGPYQTIDGAFDGLDLPGWKIEGDGVMEGGGYVVTNIDPDPSGETRGAQDSISREVIGRGSFVSQVEINDLYLGDVDDNSPPTAEGRVVLQHRLGSEAGVDRLRILLSESIAPDGQWVLSILWGGTQHVENVAQGEDILLSILYDNNESAVTFTYEPNTDDNVGRSRCSPMTFALSG